MPIHLYLGWKGDRRSPARTGKKNIPHQMCKTMGKIDTGKPARIGGQEDQKKMDDVMNIDEEGAKSTTEKEEEDVDLGTEQGKIKIKKRSRE